MTRGQETLPLVGERAAEKGLEGKEGSLDGQGPVEEGGYSGQTTDEHRKG